MKLKRQDEIAQGTGRRAQGRMAEGRERGAGGKRKEKAQRTGHRGKPGGKMK